MTLGAGPHPRTRTQSVDWLTPPAIIAALGPFDLDPCAAPEPRPWPTARVHIAPPADGLTTNWRTYTEAGRTPRVWLNPPYTHHVWAWVNKLATHGTGTALIFARTDTLGFAASVWRRADAVVFLGAGRWRYESDGRESRSKAAAPLVLAAYGERDARALADAVARDRERRPLGLAGHYIALTTIGAIADRGAPAELVR